MCKHDPEYKRQNEAAGGYGCPLCKQNKRVVMVQHADGSQEVDDDFGLSAADIAEINARCDETASAEEYSSATEGHW